MITTRHLSWKLEAFEAPKNTNPTQIVVKQKKEMKLCSYCTQAVSKYDASIRCVTCQIGTPLRCINCAIEGNPPPSTCARCTKRKHICNSRCLKQCTQEKKPTVVKTRAKPHVASHNNCSCNSCKFFRFGKFKTNTDYVKI